jgi:hypothetical protein
MLSRCFVVTLSGMVIMAGMEHYHGTFCYRPRLRLTESSAPREPTPIKCLDQTAPRRLLLGDR